MLDVKVPKRPTRKGWRVSERAVRRAARRVGITKPVSVVYFYATERGGQYNYENGRHVVYVATRGSREFASEVIWHELTHARQCEKYGTMSAFMNEYRKYSLPRVNHSGYESNPFEVEARKIEDRYSHILLTEESERA